MTDYELSETLKTAAKSVGDNIALQMLLLMAADRIEQLSAKDVEQSWRDNPDRMGGQFTQDEIDNAEKW
jgi:hypothetical protein